MAGTETGHEKNVANAEVFISAARSIGKAYDPANPILGVESMQTNTSNCKNAMNGVRTADAAFSNAVDAREAAFRQLDKIITRVSNTLKSSGVSSDTIATVASIIRKLRGLRANAKRGDEKNSDSGSEKVAKEVSVSQLSYDNRIGNFSFLLEQLSAVPAYKPNEKDLQTESLKAFNDELRIKNAAVVSAKTALYNARALRNELMYKDGSGLVNVILDAKKYIKGAFGASSSQYKMVAALEFKRN